MASLYVAFGAVVSLLLVGELFFNIDVIVSVIPRVGIVFVIAVITIMME